MVLSVQVSLLLLLVVMVVEVVMVVCGRRARGRRLGRRTIRPVGADVYAPTRSTNHSAVEHPFVVRVTVENVYKFAINA